MPSRESPPDGQRCDVAGPTALGDAVASARRYASDQALGPRDQARLCIIVEELVTNLIEHGGLNSPQVGIEFDRRGGAIRLILEDDGQAFDPRRAPFDDSIPDRGGNAGLRLVHGWSEIVGYETQEGRNRLELLLKLTGS